jgi:5'-methylthioadenosine phosphorylase
VLLANADNARSLVKAVTPSLAADLHATVCGCRKALEFAIITSPNARDATRAAQLDAVAGRLLKTAT